MLTINEESKDDHIVCQSLLAPVYHQKDAHKLVASDQRDSGSDNSQWRKVDTLLEDDDEQEFFLIRDAKVFKMINLDGQLEEESSCIRKQLTSFDISKRLIFIEE